MALKLLRAAAFTRATRLRVSWYHSMVINDSQVTICMAEPALYEIIRSRGEAAGREAAPAPRPAEHGRSADGRHVPARAAAANMGELLGRMHYQARRQILRRHIPQAEIYVWSDMLDPNHNAHGNYYLAEGDFTGSWKHVPKDLVMAVWGGEPREKSLRFFAGQGFRTLVACYYDAEDLKDVKGWLRLARETPQVQGLMYTPWERKYSLLPAFGDLLMGKP